MYCTFRVFVQVSDVTAFLRTNSLGADLVAHLLLLTVDLAEGSIDVPLPVDFITVYLRTQKGRWGAKEDYFYIKL